MFPGIPNRTSGNGALRENNSYGPRTFVACHWLLCLQSSCLAVIVGTSLPTLSLMMKRHKRQPMTSDPQRHAKVEVSLVLESGSASGAQRQASVYITLSCSRDNGSHRCTRRDSCCRWEISLHAHQTLDKRGHGGPEASSACLASQVGASEGQQQARKRVQEWRAEKMGKGLRPHGWQGRAFFMTATYHS